MSLHPEPRLQAAMTGLDRGDPSGALKSLASLEPGSDLIAQALTTRARAHAELGEWEPALEAARELGSLPYGQDPSRIITAEILVAAHREGEALEELQRVSEHNVIARALREVLPAITKIDGPVELPVQPSSLWFQSVLAILFIYTERALEDRAEDPSAWRARSHLLLPDLSPAAFRNPRPGPLRRAFEKLQSRERRVRSARERSVVEHFFEENLAGALGELESWIKREPDFYRGETGDPRRALVGEVLFHEGRHADFLKWVRKTEAVDAGEGEELTLRRAFSLFATGKAREARETIVDSSRVEAGHLIGQIELSEGHRERALAWFRRAFQQNDIAHVDLAMAELRALGWTLTGA